MDKFQFFQVVLAVLVGNMLTIMFLYGMYHITRAEREGRENELGPASYVMVAMPPLITGIGVWAFYL